MERTYCQHVHDADAIVIGAGPNGLVAANVLADAGWRVLVLEAHDSPGGAVRSSELVAPGFVSDWASSFYPVGIASPVLRALELESFGLAWRHAPLALAHPTPDGCAFIETGHPEATAASVDHFAPGDGEKWLRLYRHWARMGAAFFAALTEPFPPVRGALRVARAAGFELPWLCANALRSLRGATSRFEGEGGRLLLAGNALHADLTPESSGGVIRVAGDVADAAVPQRKQMFDRQCCAEAVVAEDRR